MSEQIDPVLLTRDVVAATGLSRPTIARKVKAGDFPKPFAVTDALNGWRKSKIEAWLAERETQTVTVSGNLG